MNRRDLLKGSLFAAGALAPALASAQRTASNSGCDDCGFLLAPAMALPSSPRLKVTGVKTFGVTSPALPPDRPHVFVKIETDEGIYGWGESGLSGREKAVLGAI